MPGVRPDQKRRWRVSVFALGITDPKAAPIIHKCARRGHQERAEEHYQHFLGLVNAGQYQRVIMHQGNLQGMATAYIYHDSDKGF